MQNQDVQHKQTFILKVLIAFILLVTFVQPIEYASATVITEENLEPAEKPGLVEKHLSKFFINFANSIIGIMKAQDVSVLVFQREDVVKAEDSWITNSASADRSNMVFGVFPEALFDGISKMYDGFANLIPIPIFVLLVLGGLVLVLDLIRNTESRSNAKEYLVGIIIAILLLRFGHILWDWIIFINYIVVDTAYMTLKASGIEVKSFISTIWDPTATDKVMKSPSFGVAILVIGAAAMTFMINYQYMMRMLTLAMLVILFPFVIIATVIPSRRNTLNTWVTAFTSQVFIQAAHAIALALFFFTLSKIDDLGFWLVAAMFFGLPTLSDIVQRIVGSITGEGGGGGIGTSLSNGSGLSGLMMVGNIARGTMSKKGGNKGGEMKKGDSQEGSSGGVSSLGLSNAVGGGSSNGLTADGVSKSGNGVGGVPIGSGMTNSSTSGSPVSRYEHKKQKAMTERPQGLGKRGGAQVAQLGKKIATSDKFRAATKATGAFVGAGVGFAAGTMMTGKGQTGAMVGGVAGVGAGGVANSARDKVGKGTQVAGEVMQSRASGLKSMDMTKQRLGYNDSSQLGNPEEMKRMGQELIGGKIGSTLGGMVGGANYYAGKAGYTNSTDYDTQGAYEATNEKRDLDWNIGQQSGNVSQLDQQRQMSSTNLARVQSEYGNGSANGEAWKHKQQNKLQSAQENLTHAKNNYNANPMDPNSQKQYEQAKLQHQRATLSAKSPHPEVRKAQKAHSSVEANYHGAKQQLDQMQQKQQNFYAIRQHANETKAMQSNRRSSGAV